MNKHEKRMKKNLGTKDKEDDKDITVDGLQRTTYIKDESEGKIAVKGELM